ncbi:MAG TPA: peptide ABC transporter permease [Actinobacteria bacterium]|nr:peptide ABC transporter permease [Actinomycetota bacterium]HCK78636.1 peptide ABC transporter permease [Actinomycetota bacterium]
MAGYLVRRLAVSVLLVFLATSLAFVLAAVTMKPRSFYEARNPPIPTSSIDSALDAVNQNDKTPVLKRYTVWISGVARGDFGKTLKGDSINEEMGRRIGVSLRLLLLGSIIGAVLGVLLGVWGALKQYRLSDRAITVFSFVILASPVFFIATLLKYGAVQLNLAAGTTLLYFTGENSPQLVGSPATLLFDRIQHLILPTIAISIGSIALYSRYQRSAMLDVLGSDYLRTASAKGLTQRQTFYKHGLRTALIPMTVWFAFAFGTLVVGATFTEKIFAWQGMGAWFIDSVRAQDANVAAATTLFTAVMILFSTFLADALRGFLDPRVRDAT